MTGVRAEQLAAATDAARQAMEALQQVELKHTRGRLREDVREARALATELYVVLAAARRSDVSSRGAGMQRRPRSTPPPASSVSD